MRTLLRELGQPQERFPAIHVVGTNGKSTATRLTEALLLDAGLSVGSYLSPHVRGWSERIRIGGEEADFEAAVVAVRRAAVSASNCVAPIASATPRTAETAASKSASSPPTRIRSLQPRTCGER